MNDLELDTRAISPELALVDPTLGLRDTKEDWTMLDSLEPTNTSSPLNGSSPAMPVEPAPAPSVEALLFNAGAISADQLGELVRDAVLTQRPVAALAVERGLATPEMLAALQPGIEADVSLPAPLVEAAPAVEAASVVETAPPTPAPAPAPELVVPQLETVTVAAPAPELVQPEPMKSLDERVQAVVARAALAAQSDPAPVVATPATPAEVLPATQPAPATGTFAVLVHLRTGERLAADTATTFENAAEVARSLAAQLARAAEWPLIGGRCIRPDAVVSVDIERTLER